MTWPELKKAKHNAQEISNEIEKLMKEHNALSKREIERYSEKMAEDVNELLILLEDSYKEIVRNLKAHSKQTETKSKFIKRHYNRKK